MLILSSSAAMAYTPQYVDESNTLRLRWKNTTIKIALSNSLTRQNPNIKPDSDVVGAIQRSFETWEKAANIKFQLSWTDKQALSPAGNGDGINLITIAPTPENLLFFASDSYEMAARTREFFNRKGFITEADIVLNPYQQFSTDGSIGTFDLQAVLTHEIGHLLGLDHSFIFGATMNEHQGKNGIYNLPAFNPRTLAADDLAGIRALYGAADADENCCGTISGRLSFVGGKAAKGFQIWAQEAVTGRAVAGVLTNADGSFKIEGLPAGEYIIFSQKIGEQGSNSFSSRNIGEISVRNGKTADLTRKLPTDSIASNLQFLGFNGQISSLAVGVNVGKSYVIYLAGKNLDPNDMEVFFESPNISVTPGTFVKFDYGSEISVISFEVKLDPKTPIGEYGVFVKNRNGLTECLIGSLVVDAFENPWSSGIFTGSEFSPTQF